MPRKSQRTYMLQRVGKIWQCRVKGFPLVMGSGGRPDLAIRDWKDQKRKREALER